MAADPPSLFPEYMEQTSIQIVGSGLIDTVAVIQDGQLQVSVDTAPISVVLLSEDAQVNQIEVVIQEQPIEVTPTTAIKVKEC